MSFLISTTSDMKIRMKNEELFTKRKMNDLKACRQEFDIYACTMQIYHTSHVWNFFGCKSVVQ